jgi:hypothetical protein
MSEWSISTCGGLCETIQQTARVIHNVAALQAEKAVLEARLTEINRILDAYDDVIGG